MSMVQLMQVAVPSTARFSSVGVPAWRSSLPPLPRGRKRPVLALSYSSGNSTGRSVGCSGRRPEPASFGSLYVQGLGSRQGWRFTCHELPRLQRKLRRLVRYSRNCSYSCQAASSTDGRCGDIPPEPGRQETESQQIHYHVDPKWRLIGNCMRAAFLIWGAASCVSWISGAGQAWAAESGSVLIPPVGRAMEFWGRFWPKTLQVFGVFRDQGVLLSVLLGLSAFFSMAETSITTLWPWKVRELAEKEQEGGVFQLLRNDVTRFLTTILIGTTVANIAATALVTDAATALFGEAGISAATGVMTVVILLVTEIAPKSIAVHNATEVARVVVRPVAWLSLILYPVGRVVTALSTNLLKFLGLKHSGEPFVSEEELKLMLRGAELSGAIEEEEQDMIENVLEIKDTYVREVMTPLVDVVAIDSEATLMDFRQLWVTHQYSRVPVFERRVDNIVGIAYAMDMLDYVEQVELLQRLSVGRIAHRPAYFVPDSMSVWNLLREFRIRKVHMAIVLNEYGGAVGVVTLEDVVEEIVGEIFDENDSKEEIRKKTGYVIQRADGIFDVDANTSIEDLKDALEIKVPEGPYHYETVSGFVCEAFGYIPRTGESIPVVFEKADIEDGADRREGEQDHQDDRKEKFQWYKLEILAGNARKVGSVRFERAEGSQAKETAMNRNPSRAAKRAWEDRDSSSAKDKRVSKEWDDVGYDLDPPESKDVEQVCIVESSDDERNESTVRRRYLIAESVDVVASESPCLVADGLTVVGQQDWQIDSLAQQNREQGFETDDEVETSTATTMGTLCEKWEEQERQVERRRQRRRKQSAEATVELSRQRKGDVRRRESDMATTMYRMRGGRDDSDAAKQHDSR